MKTMFLGLMAATALATVSTPALADKADKVMLEQYRDKIVAARGEPGVQQYGGAELDRAMAALPTLKKRLDDDKTDQIKATTAEIDTLIQTARSRAQVEMAKQDASAAAKAKQDQLASQAADAERARADAAAAAAEAEKAKAQLAELKMKQTALGATLVLQDVVFETGRAELKPGASARLAPLANYLRANPEVKVRVDGHTDAQGSDALNQQLSDARASAVRTALGSMGIDPNRIQALGHGESQPIADNNNAAGRQQNRRVEITLVGQQANNLAAVQ
ncbi:OmpA family protein [Sphingomonas sp. ID0503]|uniref:OmpA family protein n=1 Tax=Sphingomonas sp. ID0503 TaxID=3399691 RepID=UPI003AFA8949